jgi:SAM-dependent methyltransferase
MDTRTNRLYDDLAWLWPLWGDPATEYRDFSARVAQLFDAHAKREVRTVLNIACGAGKNVVNLAERFEVTGLDLSERMLELARTLNPGRRFVRADMRDFDLGERFDAILLDDGISYMTRPDDLRAAFERAYAHLAPGGVMVVGPDETTESFQQNLTETWRSVPHLSPPGVEVAYVVNSYDPDPLDDWTESAMVFFVREGGELRIEHDMHRMGLFSIEVWRRLLAEVGFDVHEGTYREGDREYAQFACVRGDVPAEGDVR